MAFGPPLLRVRIVRPHYCRTEKGRERPGKLASDRGGTRLGRNARGMDCRTCIGRWSGGAVTIIGAGSATSHARTRLGKAPPGGDGGRSPSGYKRKPGGRPHTRLLEFVAIRASGSVRCHTRRRATPHASTSPILHFSVPSPAWDGLLLASDPRPSPRVGGTVFLSSLRRLHVGYSSSSADQPHPDSACERHHGGTDLESKEEQIHANHRSAMKNPMSTPTAPPKHAPSVFARTSIMPLRRWPPRAGASRQILQASGRTRRFCRAMRPNQPEKPNTQGG